MPHGIVSGARGPWVRAFIQLIVFHAAVWALAAGLSWLIAKPELAKAYYSAHQSVRATWALLVPALAAGAVSGFLVAAVGTGVGLRALARRMQRPILEQGAVLRELAVGRIPSPPPPAAGSAQVGDARADAALALAPLGEHVRELQRLSREIQKTSLGLTFKTSGTEEVTLKDLRAIASQLDGQTRELSGAVKWFEL